MADMSFGDGFSVRCSTGTYSVSFGRLASLGGTLTECAAVVVDANVWRLHGDALARAGVPERRYEIAVSESIKTPETALGVCGWLADSGFRRGERLLAIGGGVIQDIATFAASCLYRGVSWSFLPTTLLAQADSCLGGKSSLNLGLHKNLIGNFYPPTAITICDEFIGTLDPKEVRSGIGEILKVMLLSGPDAAAELEASCAALSTDRGALASAVRRALELKRDIVELDEFDTGPRLRMNFGHSFGHALEAATHFGIPHGIAVTMGIGVAARVAAQLGRLDGDVAARVETIARSNLRESDRVPVPRDKFLASLRRDKKNAAQLYRFALPVGWGEVALTDVPMTSATDDAVLAALAAYLDLV